MYEVGEFFHSVPSEMVISGLLTFHICSATLYGFHNCNIGTKNQITAILGEITSLAPMHGYSYLLYKTNKGK